MSRRHIKAFALFTGCVLSVAATHSWAADNSAALKAELDDHWHVTVVEKDLAGRILPLVATAGRPITMQDLSAGNERACLQAAVTAFQAYSASLVSTLVKTLALADQITVWTIRVGGFHAPGLIALNCQQADQNQDFDRDSVHDELAALVQAKAPIEATAWQALNPPGFRYGNAETYRDELRNPHGRAGDGALHRNGFVAALGLTSRENDIQTYAERIFGHPAEFADMLRHEPAMRAKARMVMALYMGQAPSLAGRFDALGLTAAAQ